MTFIDHSQGVPNPDADHSQGVNNHNIDHSQGMHDHNVDHSQSNIDHSQGVLDRNADHSQRNCNHNQGNNQVTILLVTIVNVDCYQAYQTNKQDRINIYLKSIRNWLNNTNFNIVVVENSGYYFEELAHELAIFSHRFELIVYHQSIVYNHEYDNVRFFVQGKGGNEIFQIHYAYNHSQFLQNALFIIKVTGRFFVPELQNFLSNYDLNNWDGLSQNDQEHCEIVGAHQRTFGAIFDRNLINFNGIFDAHIENVFIVRFRNFGDKIIRCPVFNIEPTQKGGLPIIVTEL